MTSVADTCADWIIGSPAHARPFNDATLQVWLDDGSVRRVRLHFGSCYRLLDISGIHPLTNILVDGDRILAWRPLP